MFVKQTNVGVAMYNHKRHLCFHILIVVIFVFSSCAKRISDITYPVLSDGRYDTEFPYSNCSTQLEEIGKTVKLVNAIAYYTGFVFEEESWIKSISDDIIREKSVERISYTNSASGTATIIFSNYDRIALITCAHVLDFPDTVLKYYVGESKTDENIIQSVAFKKRQVNYVIDLPEGGEIDVILMDRESDIAVLGKDYRFTRSEIVPSFIYPIGDAKKLEWGSFVYLFGYPKGYKMVTKGIVSDPNRDRSGSFLLDAPFNRGFSGGIVLAIKDGVPNFELVGIAKSSAADFENVLIPPEDFDASEYDPHLPYEGDIYVKSNAIIRYGITQVISINTVIDFLEENQRYFTQMGYDFSSFTVNKSERK